MGMFEMSDEHVAEWRQKCRDLVADEATRGVEQADADQLGDGVDEARAAQAAGGDVADHLQLHRLVTQQPDHLDSAVSRSQSVIHRAEG